MKYLTFVLIVFLSANAYAMKRAYPFETQQAVSSRDAGFFSLDDLIKDPKNICLNTQGHQQNLDLTQFLLHKSGMKWSFIQGSIRTRSEGEKLGTMTEWHVLHNIALFLTSEEGKDDNHFDDFLKTAVCNKEKTYFASSAQGIHVRHNLSGLMTPQDFNESADNILVKYRNKSEIFDSLEDIKILIYTSLCLFGQTPQTFRSNFFVNPMTGKVQMEDNTFDATPWCTTLLKLSCAIHFVQKSLQTPPRDTIKHIPSTRSSSTASTVSISEQTIIALTKVRDNTSAHADIIEKLYRELLLRNQNCIQRQRNDKNAAHQTRHFCLFFSAYFLASTQEDFTTLTKKRYGEILQNPRQIMSLGSEELSSLANMCARDLIKFYGLEAESFMQNSFYNRPTKSWIIPYKSNLPQENQNWPGFLSDILKEIERRETDSQQS